MHARHHNPRMHKNEEGGVKQAQAKQDSEQGQTTKASHISTRTHIYISGHTHLHTHLRGCMYVYLQVTTCKYTYIHVYKYMHVCAQISIGIQIHIYACRGGPSGARAAGWNYFMEVCGVDMYRVGMQIVF